ncbi:MAG: hypothetical protein ACRCUE_16190 [Bosea sp. (in: a-proteobacteria)]
MSLNSFSFYFLKPLDAQKVEVHSGFVRKNGELGDVHLVRYAIEDRSIDLTVNASDRVADNNDNDRARYSATTAAPTGGETSWLPSR